MCYFISDRPFNITFRTTWLSDLLNPGAEEGDFATDEVEDFFTYVRERVRRGLSVFLHVLCLSCSPHTYTGCKTRIQSINQGDFAS